ncbi:GAF and ANTAR domain-containing protein [Labedella endophytica]|uniref:ANTAR domain-containing protein n=1 Tax=Labedella endophytica TaxID=1523160 RepID=A0A3S0VRR5_9MICO|nr:GAF and ANTAR domain-containing protein [Labedella endophytica]RUQ98295.1 ANTAR domain-containing protein [Labedella endophytica]
MTEERFTAALAALSRPSGGSESLTEPILGIIPVTGASVSTIGELLGMESVEASDAIIRRIDELQFDMSEGPCWDAVERGEPILEPDFRHRPRGMWPRFSEGVRVHDVGALFAVPVSLGTLRVGAIDLYHRDPIELDDEAIRRLLIFGGVIGRRVLRRALESTPDAADEVSGGGRHSRYRIHQAAGFVIAQLGVTADDALLLLQARAFSTGSSMEEIAEQILEKRLTFSVTGAVIEDRT